MRDLKHFKQKQSKLSLFTLLQMQCYMLGEIQEVNENNPRRINNPLNKRKEKKNEKFWFETDESIHSFHSSKEQRFPSF